MARVRKRNANKETTKVDTTKKQPEVATVEEQEVVEPTEESVVVEHTEQPTDAELADKQPEVEPVEETKEQPEVATVEETKEQQPEVEEPKEVTEEPKEVLTGITKEQADIAAMLDKQAIDSLLEKPGMGIEDKLKVIAEKAIPTYKQLAAKLLGYVEAMGVGIVDPNIGVGKQLDLVNTLKQAVETKDSGEFKTKLDIVNLAFMAYKDSALNVYKVYRFDDKWKWNKKDLTTLQHLTMIISTLASLADRKENIKKIDLEKALNKDEVNLSADAINNIKSYYKA